MLMMLPLASSMTLVWFYPRTARNTAWMESVEEFHLSTRAHINGKFRRFGESTTAGNSPQMP